LVKFTVQSLAILPGVMLQPKPRFRLSFIGKVYS
jgi:hypothetical protein